ncbi:MAG: Fe-Mn family superoxide dismutase [Candidatus Methanoperedens sp.]|nr:Fe-Mn family superoxide dismutase [Candidatus Methanoperedens sp.]
MTYEAKNFESLLGTKGLSDQLLKNHFTLYQGYVTNTNKVADALAAMAKDGKTATSEYAELKRRFGWEFNGMRLHEYYFENIVKDGKTIDKNTKLYKKIVSEFGSYEGWEKDFRATGAMRGIGWVILYYDALEGKLFNTWINEHDIGHLCGALPLIVMDVFEHAYMIDYGLKKGDYIEAFMKAIDWTVEPEVDSWIQ